MFAKVALIQALVLLPLISHAQEENGAEAIVEQIKQTRETLQKQQTVITAHIQYLETLDHGRLLFLQKTSERMLEAIQKPLNLATTRELERAIRLYFGSEKTLKGLAPKVSQKAFDELFELARVVAKAWGIEDKVELPKMAADTLGQVQIQLDAIYRMVEDAKGDVADRLRKEIPEVVLELKKVLPKAEVQGDSFETMQQSIPVVYALRRMYKDLNEFNPVNRTDVEDPIHVLQGALETYVDTVRLEKAVQEYEKKQNAMGMGMPASLQDGK